MLELRQLDLQLALVGAGALGEDVEDQPRTREHTALQSLLEIAFLARRKIVIEDRDLCLARRTRCSDFIDLARTDVEPGIWLAARAAENGHHIGTGRARQVLELDTV